MSVSEVNALQAITEINAVEKASSVKAVIYKKKEKALSTDSQTLKDSLSFEKMLLGKLSESKNEKIKNGLTDKLSENNDIQLGNILSDKNISKEEIMPLPKLPGKNKTQELKQDLRQDQSLNDLLSPQAAVKTEPLSTDVLKNIELKDAELLEEKALKENPTFTKNIVSQLFEKSTIEKNTVDLVNYLNQNINLKENNELKKDKKDFFKVVDLRRNGKTSQSAERIAESLRVSGKESQEMPQAKGFSFSGNNMNQNNMEMKELSNDSQMQLSAGKMQQFDSSLVSSRTPVSSFHTQFIEYLRENGNANIVKNANIILKENNEGEIKLLMKPESLGYVRIKLMLNDNHITGKIIVDNHSVKEVFESNLENLIKNFKESGYSSAAIDVAVGGEKNNKEKQSLETDKVLALKEIEKNNEHTMVRTMLAENRLVDLVI